MRRTTSTRRIVEGGRCLAVFVIYQQADFGKIASRTTGCSTEDNIVHLATAHLLGGGLPHDPSEGLDEIRFAATVRPDDAGHTLFDHQLGRIDKGLESRKTKFGEMHPLDDPYTGKNAQPAWHGLLIAERLQSKADLFDALIDVFAVLP